MSKDSMNDVISSVQDFCNKYLEPHTREWDQNSYFPSELFSKLGELGLTGILVNEQYGGSGMDYHFYTKIIEEISKVDPAIGLSIAAQNSLCVNHINLFGSEGQKSKYLSRLCRGEIGAWALTEDNAGSDAGSIKTIAKKTDNGWILNGSKNFTTHGKSGDIIVILARTGGPKEISSFILEKNTPGLKCLKVESKLGMNASETAQIFFENCHIPKENLIGKIGEGFSQALKVLDGGRISIAALSLGTAKGAYRLALKYSREREQFGKPIGSFQGISFKLAEMATRIKASELLIKESCNLYKEGKNITSIAAMAKLYASETAVDVSNEALQIFGGYGYLKDYPIEKFYRDAKLCTIGEGTSEILKLVISRHL